MSTQSSNELSENDSGRIKVSSGSNDSTTQSNFQDEDKSEVSQEIDKTIRLRPVKSARINSNFSKRSASDNLSTYLSASQEELRSEESRSSITQKEERSFILESNENFNEITSQQDAPCLIEENQLDVEIHGKANELDASNQVENLKSNTSIETEISSKIDNNKLETKETIVKNEHNHQLKEIEISSKVIESLVSPQPPTLSEPNSRPHLLTTRLLSLQNAPFNEKIKLKRFNTIHNFNLPIENLKISTYVKENSRASSQESDLNYSDASSDFALGELFFEFEYIDKETREAVELLMEKMLKTIKRKLYLYEAKVLKRPEDTNKEIQFFTRDDNLIDIDREIHKENMKLQAKKKKIGKIKEVKLFAEEEEEETNEVDEFNNDETSSTTTEISLSNSNEYFSFLPSDTGNEQVDDAQVIISSEENSYSQIGETDRFIKEEMKYLSMVTSIKRILTREIKGESEKILVNKQLTSENTTFGKLLHDDFFLTETKIQLVKNDLVKEKQKVVVKPQIKSQDSKKLNLAQNKSVNEEKSRVKHKKKNPTVERREAKIADLEKIFKDPLRDKSGRKIDDAKVKSRPITAASSIRPKSAIRIKYVPETVDMKAHIKLPKLPPAIKNNKTTAKPTNTGQSTNQSIVSSRVRSAVYPVDERQMYPRPTSSKQPWGTVVHPPYGLGYQKMTHYEIKQSVERLFSASSKSKPNQAQETRMKAISFLPESDYIDMINRLTNGSSDKPPDRCRTQQASIYRNLGVLNSYAWKGYTTLSRF